MPLDPDPVPMAPRLDQPQVVQYGREAQRVQVDRQVGLVAPHELDAVDEDVRQAWSCIVVQDGAVLDGDGHLLEEDLPAADGQADGLEGVAFTLLARLVQVLDAEHVDWCVWWDVHCSGFAGI